MSVRWLPLVFALVVTACGGGSDTPGAETTGDGTGNEPSESSTSGTTADPDSSSSDGGSESGTDGEPGMPIGIPEPELGFYEPTPAMPQPWADPIAGAYYVDNTSAAATDDESATGTPSAPRRTIPATVPAGATVWIAGGPYPGFALAASGTADAPVFVTAVDPGARPVIEGGIGISGSWLVVEHLDVSGPTSGIAIATPSDHIAVRHCEIHGGEGGGAGLYTGRWEPEDDPAIAQHIVLWDNFVHDNGNLAADFDEDHHGIALGHHAEQVWILDNELAKNSGDGLQINAKKAGLAETLNHVWVGRNHAHENKQTGLWTKQATDVVFSQNVAWGHRPSNSSEGACAGFQYGPERVWFIFNVFYDCETGLRSSTSVGDEDDVAGSGQDVYIVGNIIAGIHKQDGSGPSEDPWQGGAGIGLTDESATKHVAFNTIVDVDVAFTYARGTGGVEIVDNMFVASLGYAIGIETSEAALASSVDHSFFDTGAGFRWGGVGTDLAGLTGMGQCAACLQGDPLVVDAMAGDYHLQDGSPAIDAGAASELPAIYEARYGVSIDVDFDRTPRAQGAAPDPGAYERG